jgi:hypothetical protein
MPTGFGLAQTHTGPGLALDLIHPLQIVLLDSLLYFGPGDLLAAADY